MLVIPEPQPISFDELLQRVAVQPDSNVWSVLTIDAKDIQSIIDDLQETVEIFLEAEAGFISGKNGVNELVEQVVKSTQDYLVIWQLEAWQTDDWKTFDACRSRLDRHKKGGLLLLASETVRTMLVNAPNFGSWLGARIYSLNKDTEILTQEEGEKRLVALRERTGKSDEDVVALAEKNMLPVDPEYGEWLILLNRGDLLERRK